MGTKFAKFAKWLAKTDFFSLLVNGWIFEEQLGHERRSNLKGEETPIPISTAMDEESNRIARSEEGPQFAKPGENRSLP